MKKIFTLLFCVTVVSIGASAADYTDLVNKCINVLLGAEQPTTLMATNLDANHDGVIDIADVTTLIDMNLQANQPYQAPAQEIDVDGIINKILVNEEPTPVINDVSDAIDNNLKIKKEE